MTIPRTRNPHRLKGCDLPGLRQQLLDEQDGECPICGLPVDAPCLDHSHKRHTKGTGLVRGVLCRSCNVLLGKIENNCTRYKVSHKALPLVLRNMACYLERPHKNILHPSERERPKKLKKSSYNLLKKRAKAAGVPAKRMPDFPKSGLLTKPLEAMFLKYDLEPEFYK